MVIMLLLLSFILIASAQVGVVPNALAQNKTSECVEYESKQKLIHISCKSIHLSDLNEYLNNASILYSESNANPNAKIDTTNGKVWILNAGIVIEKEAELVIDSSDTSWLKLVPTPTIQPAKQLVPLVEENDTDIYDEAQIEGTIASK